MRAERLLRSRALPVLILLSAVSLPEALANGVILLDTSSFLRSSSQRPTNSSSLRLGTQLESQRSDFATRADLRVDLATSSLSSITFEAKELYLKYQLSSSNHELWIGRKLERWSEADEYWKLGLWSPRYSWDPLHPEQVGSTGLGYNYQHSLLHARAAVSPISIPERGAQLSSEDGRLTSTSPLWVPPYEAVRIQNQQLAMHYQLALPSTSELLLNPSLSGSFRLGGDLPSWASLGYAYQPMSQADIAVESRIQLPDTRTLYATLHPQFPYHHLASIEAGHGIGRAKFWGSLTREIPVRGSIPESWMRSPIGPAWLASVGGEYAFARKAHFAASYLRVIEHSQGGPTPDFELNLPSRFLVKNGVKLTGETPLSDRIHANVGLIIDFEEEASLCSVDVRYRHPAHWQVGLGADLISSPDQNGARGQFRGNDSIRWTRAYVF